MPDRHHYFSNSEKGFFDHRLFINQPRDVHTALPSQMWPISQALNTSGDWFHVVRANWLMSDYVVCLSYIS